MPKTIPPDGTSTPFNPELSADETRVLTVEDGRSGGILASLGRELPRVPPSAERLSFYTSLRESLAAEDVLVADPTTPADTDGETAKGAPGELKKYTEQPSSGAIPIATTSTEKASLRVVSWLWDTTVPGNPFGTDGPKKVPPAWPGDKLTKCRQWHGIDISCDVKNGSFIRQTLKVSTPKYIGVTSVCGLLGKAHLTDRKVTTAVWGEDKRRGEYVEVTALLGSRLGAFIPDIDVGIPSLLGRAKVLGLTGIGFIFNTVQQFIEEFIEQVSEEGYLGETSAVAKIYTRIGLRLYTSGRSYSGFESNIGGNGFQSTKEIIDDDISYSFMPEHHAYINGKHLLGITPKSTDGYPETVKWVDSWRPYDVLAFFVLSDAIAEWCKNTPLAEKKKVAAAFKKEYPKLFVGTAFK